MPDPGGDAALRQALLGRLGCSGSVLMALTPEERRRCEARQDAALAAVRAGPIPKYDLDRDGRFTEDETPYLARKPKNGCKLMAGGQGRPIGGEAAVAGVGCAVSF